MCLEIIKICNTNVKIFVRNDYTDYNDYYWLKSSERFKKCENELN